MSIILYPKPWEPDVSEFIIFLDFEKGDMGYILDRTKHLHSIWGDTYNQWQFRHN